MKNTSGEKATRREPEAQAGRQAARLHSFPLRPLFSILLILSISLSASACNQAAIQSQPPVTITIAGSTAMHPVLADLTNAFTNQHPNALFDLRGGGSRLGETWTGSGRADIGASTLFPPEAGDASSTENKLVHTPIGVDGIAVIVHPGNPIDGLTLAELRELYTGRITNWHALGGQEEDVLLISREDGSGTRALFDARTVADEAVALTSIVMPTSATVVEYVAAHPQAIGYVSRAYAYSTAQAQAGPAIKIIAIDGRLPTLDALAEQAYALAQPLYLVTDGPPTGAVRQFIDFALSPAGQEIVGAYHLPVRE
ncbi:MAG: phosphate ABC transporter substrate-binding protein [Caldilineaceae bacterium]|nr:phosphate ABC transporter substrate-binding protein [Caldilineaceae bacterium]